MKNSCHCLSKSSVVMAVGSGSQRRIVFFFFKVIAVGRYVHIWGKEAV